MTPPTSLFLFAHQDDEFGVFHQIKHEVQRGRRVVCAYLTTGVPSGVDPHRRNLESLSVLGRLGVSSGDVVFAGEQLSVPDGQLVERLEAVSEWLESWLQQNTLPVAIFVMAWEGGHPDHDGSHALAIQAAAAKGLIERVKQFPLYNGWQRPWKFFSVLSPLKQNGPVCRSRIPWADRLRFLRYCLSYPSQKTTWIGLFPFVLLHYVLHGTQVLQAVSQERIRDRPHSGPLYYERRGFCTWEKMSGRLSGVGMVEVGKRLGDRLIEPSQRVISS